MELMKSALPPKKPDEFKNDDMYDCGEDKSLIETKFPNDRPPPGNVVSSPPAVQIDQNKKNRATANDDDDDDLISVSPNDEQAGHRFPRRTRQLRVPYQHRP